MALIGKIRNNMWLVVVLLALALAGFIIMDMTSGGSSNSFGSKTTLGKIDGNKIDYMDFQRAEQALYQGSGDVYGRRSSLWNFFIEKTIIDKISESNGIGVGSDELNELEFGANLSPVVQSFYTNPQTGQVDRTQLEEIKKAVDEGTVTNPEFAARFNELRKQVIKTQKQTKLNNLVAKSLYTPTWYAETLDKINNESATFEYVKIPFEYVKDTDVKLTDEDFSKYIKENETKYTNKEEVRNISFLVYDVVPTAEDSAKIKDQLNLLSTEFANTKNDSLFTASNNGFYNKGAYSKKDELQGELKDKVGSLSTGQLYGPYVDAKMYILAKLVDKKVIADSAKASHILRSVAGNDPIQLAAANKHIDSIRAAITSGQTSFKDAAIANSQDPGSGANGGDLGTFVPGAMVPEFNEAVFNGKPGNLYKVTTQFGVHLIKVDNLVYKTNEVKYNVAYLVQPLVPSEATQNAIKDKVMATLEKTKSIDELNKLATGDMKIEVAGGIKKNDHILSNLPSGQTSRDIIRWAFEDNTDAGKVSPELYTFADEANYVDSKYLIAALKSIDKPGIATVESVKTNIEALVKNAKKAEIIKSKMKGTDLNAIAGIFSDSLEVAENVSFGSASLPDGSFEPVLTGKVFSAKTGTVVGPVAGMSGVFMAKLTAKTPATTEAGAFMQKMMLTQQARSQVNFRLMEALKKNKEIDDNRFTFY
ncbi:MAG: peptidylprolyl isomerase [Saprospiraceae bacterium]|nr:peptidylprolyl isomerase [Saprospiraceae bacterium]